MGEARPRGDFRSEGAWRAWNTANAGKRAGFLPSRAGDVPHVVVKANGESFRLDVRALVILFDAGEWPTGRLPPWTSLPTPSRQGGTIRMRAGRDHVGRLAQFFARQCEESGYEPDELTVLHQRRDPFRLDIPTKRRDAEWFTAKFNRYFVDRDEAHLREIHYVLATAVPAISRPTGQPYRNTHADWRWLLEEPAKTARWLGLVPWPRIVDSRSEDPVIGRTERAGEGKAGALVAELPVPDEYDVTPTPVLEDFGADQPIALALFAEKSSPAEAMGRLASRFHANACVGGGDQVDRRIWEMARAAYEDGRKLVVFTVCDCDPGGWNMPIAIARKLQAFAVSEFPGLELEVVRAGLTPAQVRELNLPSSPLKPSEARADRWRGAMGIEQTELDAAMALQSEAFVAAIEQAILLYFDETLAERVGQATHDWRERARAAVEEQTNVEELAELQDRYDAAREEIEAINDRLNEIAADIELPDPPARPQPDMGAKAELRAPLIDSDWGFVEGSRRLKAEKAYEVDENGESD
jgi:hypothetical protein